MSANNWLWLVSLALGALNAWQNKSIQNAILELKIELINRIAESEGEIKALKAEK